MATNEAILLNTLKNDELKPTAFRLYEITSELKDTSVKIIVGLIFSIIISISPAFLRYFSKANYFSPSNSYELITADEVILLTIHVIFVIYGIGKISRFRDLRRTGMKIYEKITDDIDWGRKRVEFINKPNETLKRIIRQFLRTVDLPFSDSATGELIYITLYLLSLFSHTNIIYFF